MERSTLTPRSTSPQARMIKALLIVLAILLVGTGETLTVMISHTLERNHFRVWEQKQ